MRVKGAACVAIIASALYANPTAAIDKDIKKTKIQIAQKDREYNKLSSSINEAAKEIMVEQNKIKSLDLKIATLEGEVEKLEIEHHEKSVEIAQIEEQKRKLENEKEELEKRLVAILAKDLSFSQVLSETEASSEEDILKAELAKTLTKSVSGYIQKLKAEYMQRQRMIAQLEVRIKQIKDSMQTLEQKRNSLATAKEERVKTIANIEKKMQSYRERLQKLAEEQKQARATLERLNILKKQKLAEIERAKQLAKQKKPTTIMAVKEKNLPEISDEDLSQDIKMMGSSYQGSKSIRYTGKKVPPPIEGGFKVIKEFGPYIDPIYKIRIHNDSVVLRANSDNVLVRNIMDGKVVFAKSVAALGNVVIVAHDNNMHSIYAHLAKIAPTIQVGKKIEQRAVVGRIDRELTFEITKEDAPINPMDVITNE